MSPRTRKFIGTVGLLAFLAVYTFIAMVIAYFRIPGASVAGQWTFYAVAGLAWVIPAGLIVTWMQRP